MPNPSDDLPDNALLAGGPYDDVRLARYLAGESTAEERAAIERWVAEVPARQSMLNAMREAYGAPRDVVPPGTGPGLAWDVAAEWRALVARREGNDRVSVIQLRPLGAAAGRRRRFIWAGLGVTAMLCVAAVMRWHPVGGTHYREYATAAGERLSVSLPDGTHSTLAPESQLRVPATYGRGTRGVMLEGEGIFTVVHDAIHPFAVRVRGITVRDVGTTFDVRGYADDPAVRIAVAEGTVAVGATLVRQGEVAVNGREGVTVTSASDIGVYSAWLQGRLVFSDTPLRDVARALERTFGLTVAVPDSALAREPVTGSFGGQPLDDVLEDITAVVGSEYERHGKQVIIRRRVPNVSRPTRSAPAVLRTVLAPTRSE